jgi:hypothetical protein
VTGPYTGIPCRLTLVSSRTRVDIVTEDYAAESHFQIHTGTIESTIISDGRDDAGLFAADHRDERYLPFEGMGAISDWNLKLTSAVPTFDWSTITDVVLHVRYTAREGGDLLRDAAIGALNEALDGIPLRRAFSARSEFPSAWNAFLHPAEGEDVVFVLKIDIAENHFPYIARNANLSIGQLDLVALVKDPSRWTSIDSIDVVVTPGGQPETTSLASSGSLYGGQPFTTVSYANSQAVPGQWTVSVPNSGLGAPSNWMDDLVIVITYDIDIVIPE